jgi:hypothetical protein
MADIRRRTGSNESWRAPRSLPLFHFMLLVTFRETIPPLSCRMQCNALSSNAHRLEHQLRYEFVAGKFWRSAAKLSYMILLIHMEVLVYIISSATNLSYFTMNVVMRDFGAAYLYCIPLALLLHVIYENQLFVNTARRRLFVNTRRAHGFRCRSSAGAVPSSPSRAQFLLERLVRPSECKENDRNRLNQS